jgi:hypothetical protein
MGAAAQTTTTASRRPDEAPARSLRERTLPQAKAGDMIALRGRILTAALGCARRLAA